MKSGVGTGLAILRNSSSNRGNSSSIQLVIFIFLSFLHLTTSLNQSTIYENCKEFRISQINENCEKLGSNNSNSTEVAICNVFNSSANIVCTSKFSPVQLSQQPIEEFCSANRTSKVLHCEQMSNCKEFQLVDSKILQNNASDCQRVCNKEGKTDDICWFLVHAFNKIFQDVAIDTSPQQTTVNPIPTIVATPDKQDQSPTNLKIDEPKEETVEKNENELMDVDESNTEAQSDPVNDDKEIGENVDVSDTKQQNEESLVKDHSADNNDIVDVETNEHEESNLSKQVEDSSNNDDQGSIFPKNHDEGQDTMNTGPYIEDESSFLPHFIFLAILCITAYLVYHNKSKILALVLEGRRGQNARRRSGGRTYTKLDSTLEENMDLKRETSLRQVIY